MALDGAGVDPQGSEVVRSSAMRDDLSERAFGRRSDIDRVVATGPLRTHAVDHAVAAAPIVNWVDDFDIYVVHASEDEPIVAPFARALEDRGLQVWFNSFTPGLGQRGQMEDGLRRSSFGAVIVTPLLLTKKWAIQEFDALMDLEDPTRTRIVPIWVDVSKVEVQAMSPMLAARSAVIAEGTTAADMHRAADEVAETVFALTSERSPGQWLRARVVGGLSWLAPPAVLLASFRHIDEHIDDGYNLALFARYPDSPHPNTAGEPRPLRDFLENPTAWDGVEISAIGRQSPGTLQILTEHTTMLGSRHGQPFRLASWVFQLHSRDFESNHTVYVHACGPSAPGLRPDMPADWLTWVTGVPVAYGSVMTLDGRGAYCLYIAARAIYGHPPVSDDPPN